MMCMPLPVKSYESTTMMKYMHQNTFKMRTGHESMESVTFQNCLDRQFNAYFSKNIPK